MAAPNLASPTTITGKTTYTFLPSTAATLVASNAANSNKVLKINTLNIANYTISAVTVTVGLYTAAALGGTMYHMAGTISIPAYSTLNLIDKTSTIYLEEDESIGATAGTANALSIICSYEEIS
jgi:hypothetical protein